MNLLAELQRRNVIRMAGLYLVGAWLAVQVAATVFPAFGLPDWALRGVILLLAIGFVPALVFSWVFELTPDGLKRDGEVAANESLAPQTAQLMNRMLLVAMALALGYFAVDKFVLAPARVASGTAASTPTGTPTAAGTDAPASAPSTASPAGAKPADTKSIAVLAFADLSQAQDQAYFSDGVAEEILNALAKVDELKVAGRTSSFYFKGRNEPLATIGSTLGVAHVLEGSVRKQGERLRISAKLLRVSDGVELWTESFDGTDADIFALQERIARQVTRQLKVALNAGQGTLLVDTGTQDPVAYALYLRATDAFNRRAASEFETAARQLQEAVALDPSFARAWSKLGALQVLMPEYIGADLEASIDAAESHARRALALQPRFAEPHGVIGAARMRMQRFVQARASFEQAMAIDPDDVQSTFWYSVFLSVTGDQRARVERLEHALALDPMLPNALNHFGNALALRGDLERARQTIERARSLGGANSDIFLAFVSLDQGRTAEARVELERSVETFGRTLPPGVSTLIASGILDEGEPRARALHEVRNLVSQPVGADSGILAWALILLGAPDDALAMVARQPMNANAWHIALWGPRGQGARGSPAFPEFARKVGFAALWDEYGPPDHCRKDASGDYRCE